MKIIDIMKESATLLGLNKDRVAMEQIKEENQFDIMADFPNVGSLFNLVKYSIRELCSSYVPMCLSTKIKIVDGKCALSALMNFIRVQHVLKNSECVKFKIINRNIVIEEDGEYDVEYLAYPEIESMFDEIDFLNHFSPDVIVLGLCSYYALANGMFDEFENFHDEYVEKAESLKDLKIISTPCRRWE